MTITKERLAEIKARAEAATPGPWEPFEWYHSDDGGWAAVGPHHVDVDGYEPDEPGSLIHERATLDAAFISAARTDVPDLVAEVERLRELISDIEAGADGDGDCPWCASDPVDGYERHFDDCPAFTPEGKVK